MAINENYIVGVDHVGIAVPDISMAIQQYEQLGFHKTMSDIIYEESHGVQAIMMENNGFVIELIAPLEEGKESPVDAYITKKPYTMYHVAYVTSDLDKQIELLKKNKYILTVQPKPSSVQKGKRAAFLANRKLGVIELVEG